MKEIPDIYGHTSIVLISLPAMILAKPTSVILAAMHASSKRTLLLFTSNMMICAGKYTCTRSSQGYN